MKEITIGEFTLAEKELPEDWFIRKEKRNPPESRWERDSDFVIAISHFKHPKVRVEKTEDSYIIGFYHKKDRERFEQDKEYEQISTDEIIDFIKISEKSLESDKKIEETVMN